MGTDIFLDRAAGDPAAQQSAPRPHIIYILADDLGWKDVGFHGSDIKTPNIDTLARTGATLEQFYVQTWCTQTRAAMLTGRYPLRYGLQTLVIMQEHKYGLATDEWLLPQALKEAGYTTAIIGKWHLGHAKREFWPRQRGFDYQYGPLIGRIDYFTHLNNGQRSWYRNNEPLEEQGYVTTLLGRDAARLIGGHDPSIPLFLYLPFTAPHSPYQAPQEYLDQYKHIADPTRRAYAAMITAMDDQIGKVVQALEARRMRENTLIIFHSDNGGSRMVQAGTKAAAPADNGPYRDGKGSLYEGGTRSPSLINWPGRIKSGGVVNEMMHVVDYYPTIAKLANASVGKTKPLDGIDLWPTLSEGRSSPRQEVVYNVDLDISAVREGDWKLLWQTTLPSMIELYNVAQDPSETTNLANRYPEKVRKLQDRIYALSKESVRSLFRMAA